MPRFRNPQTGDIFPAGVAEFCGKYFTQPCEKCPIDVVATGKCELWVEKNPHEAAYIMGYEVIEDNILAPEYNPQEISYLIAGDELLRQTAEEAAELAQAALKVIRAAKGTTPLDGEDAVDMLIEEIADVQNCIAVLSERLPGLRDRADKISVEKMKRWEERLRAQK